MWDRGELEEMPAGKRELLMLVFKLMMKANIYRVLALCKELYMHFLISQIYLMTWDKLSHVLTEA